ncbi:MAG TPA: prolyl oligopeptidase family serine peptidase, partial [Thermoanaerobaculia bacterium]|nr:prolyl oligopeptidase family serine peptidase [Thermoanaerobaculia bacterium]
FWTTEVFEVTGLPKREGRGGRVVRIELVLEQGAAAGSGLGVRRLALPETAEVVDGFRGRLVVRLQDDWQLGEGMIRAGSVILVDPAAIRDGGRHGREPRGIDPPALELLVEPSASQVVEEVEVTDGSILVTMLDNVRGRLYRFTPGAAGRASGSNWIREAIPFPENGSVALMTAHHESGDAMVLFESFTTPPTLYHAAPGGGAPLAVAAQDATFDGSRFEVTQQWAISKDGTRIPYFVVAPKGIARDGRNPVHLWSYGGFRSSLTPSYSGSYEQLYGAYGKLWLERGGVFVLANIRGGAEFGPAWHSSVLKENHERIFEDFEAVAEDLVRSGITSAERIGIEGRSNGGLLTLATMIRRPDLYGAVVSGVPLSDMRRYHEMLAGASWIAEYGDPRIPEEWAYLSRYSPYQNLRAGVDYPPVFIFTSTRDDRVHPGHARKTVARLQELGHEVWYYENTEGGHGGSSTNEQLAYRLALTYAHLWREVGG